MSVFVPTLVRPKVPGGAVACTTGVGAEEAVPDPAEFEAVTVTFSVESTSAPTTP